jgi:hypothetical protein
MEVWSTRDSTEHTIGKRYSARLGRCAGTINCGNATSLRRTKLLCKCSTEVEPKRNFVLASHHSTFRNLLSISSPLRTVDLSAPSTPSTLIKHLLVTEASTFDLAPVLASPSIAFRRHTHTHSPPPNNPFFTRNLSSITKSSITSPYPTLGLLSHNKLTNFPP